MYNETVTGDAYYAHDRRTGLITLIATTLMAEREDKKQAVARARGIIYSVWEMVRVEMGRKQEGCVGRGVYA